MRVRARRWTCKTRPAACHGSRHSTQTAAAAAVFQRRSGREQFGPSFFGPRICFKLWWAADSQREGRRRRRWWWWGGKGSAITPQGGLEAIIPRNNPPTAVKNNTHKLFCQPIVLSHRITAGRVVLTSFTAEPRPRRPRRAGK